MDLELSHVIDWTHSVINLVLLLISKRTINSFIVQSFARIVLIQISIVELLIQNSTKCLTWVELEPGRGEHEVDVSLQLITPELDHTSQVELTYHVVRLDQRVHVSLQPMLCIDTLLIKLDLNKAIRVRSNDEVDFCPVDHDNFLHVVDDIGQLGRD